MDPCDEYGPGMPTPITFSGPTASAAIDRRERGIDAAAETDDRFLKSAFAHVVARAQHQRGIYAGFFACDLLVHFAGQALRIEIDQIFFEGLALRDDLPSRLSTMLDPSNTRLSLPPT